MTICTHYCRLARAKSREGEKKKGAEDDLFSGPELEVYLLAKLGLTNLLLYVITSSGQHQLCHPSPWMTRHKKLGRQGSSGNRKLRQQLPPT